MSRKIVFEKGYIWMYLVSHIKWFLTTLFSSIRRLVVLHICKTYFTEERFSSKMFQIFLASFLTLPPINGQIPMKNWKIFCRCYLIKKTLSDIFITNLDAFASSFIFQQFIYKFIRKHFRGS